MGESVDANVGNIVSLTKGEPEGVLYKFVGLASEDADADTDTVDDDDVKGELDNVAMVVEDIEMNGDSVVDADTEAVCDGVAMELVEGSNVDETLEDAHVEGEPDNVTSDEIEGYDEILDVCDGLFEEVTDEVDSMLSVKKVVELIEGGYVGSPVGVTLFDDIVVGELMMIVEEIVLVNEGSIVVDSVDSNDSVKSEVGVKKLNDETVLVNEGKTVAEALNDIDEVKNGLDVNKPVEDTKGDDVMD